MIKALYASHENDMNSSNNTLNTDILISSYILGQF